MTYMFILKCALKLVLKNILYYDARSEKHENGNLPVISRDSRVSVMKYATSEHTIVKCTVGLLPHCCFYNTLLCPVGKHTVTLTMS